MPHNRQRLDLLLVERGLTASREKAQRLILAGRVYVAGCPLTKAGQLVDAQAAVSVSAPERFVSRGGEKLAYAFVCFGLNVQGQICLDVGASTGGFTDCLLQHGAGKVYAVDVGTAQLHWTLRQNPRVVVMEHVNARYLRPADLAETPALAAIDVAFISLTKILPAVKDIVAAGGGLVTLIKPQFEAGRREVGKGGVVRNPAVRDRVVRDLRVFGEHELGLIWQDVVPSPLEGPAGNVEFLAYWKKT